MTIKLDLLIKNGRIIDGTGNPYFFSDIGIVDGKIACLAQGLGPSNANRVLDAAGLTVCPGFIDTHSHDDAYLLINPQCDEKVCQGVTTDVIGNCGFSLVPLTDMHRDDMRKASAIMGGSKLPHDFWQLSSFAEFLTRLENAGVGINVVPLVGHGTVRIAVLGYENRPPDKSELAQMKRLTAEAMQGGAFGLSSGLIYAPANYAATGEITELATVAAQFKGIYTTHMRSEGDQQMAAIEETLKIAREAGIAAHISHHKIAGRNNWGQSKDTLKLFADERAKGQLVTCDQYPYPAGSTFLAAALPPSFQAQGPQAFAEKLKEPAVRQAVMDEIESGSGAPWENLIKGAGFENIIISAAPRHEHYIGKSIVQIAEMETRKPYDVFFDLLIKEQMEAGMVIFMMDEADIVRIMQDPITMIGTDGIPGFGSSKVHPRMHGTFPRVLGRYVREKAAISLEAAIRKMTSLPAQTFGLYKKGILRQGLDADIVVFDPQSIIDNATFENPAQPPEGISHVIVNGEPAVEHGQIMGATSGQVLRRK
ncbi:N-acyl-D-amino-acid deacylase (EC [Olavius sp. associated proteobacterium Delta 1]|nr:N-acyl-D-amino-acid deacylase (EC [Olavius sp. associated proteobacterium Delta 1]